ncbi:MAG: hypothetical protein E6L02_05285 [Thaumarchaeota archaeon]|nr:MAG: hypothetical protein E6L02_05285 [Nitrososphaerota archaeon]
MKYEVIVSILIISVVAGGLVGLFYYVDFHIENGKVITTTSYSGAGEIGGFAAGSTGQLMFYNLTISFKGQIYHTIVACSLYSIGANFPMRVGADWVRPQTSYYLPVGCYTGK